jgi:hypothetical protein
VTKKRLKEWFKEFLPAEFFGTITAVVAASIAHFFYDNGIFVAYIGAIGEAIGFYLTLLIQRIVAVCKKQPQNKKKINRYNFSLIVANLVLEFGPAGIIDGLLLRPFFMYLFPVLLANFTLGIFIGKLVGDVTFYVLVILSHGIKEKIKKRHTNGNRSTY